MGRIVLKPRAAPTDHRFVEGTRHRRAGGRRTEVAAGLPTRRRGVWLTLALTAATWVVGTTGPAQACNPAPGVSLSSCPAALPIDGEPGAPPPASEPEPAPSEAEPQTQPPGSEATSGSIADVPAAADRLLQLVNAERRAAGIEPLAMRGGVVAIAATHSRAMAERNDIWHNEAFFTAATRRRLDAKVLGENVALNRDVDDAHRRLMASPHHRDNILDGRFRVVGMAVARDAAGRLFVTQNFVEPRARPVAQPRMAVVRASGSAAPGVAPPAPSAEMDVPPTTVAAEATVLAAAPASARTPVSPAADPGLLAVVALVCVIGLLDGRLRAGLVLAVPSRPGRRRRALRA